MWSPNCRDAPSCHGLDRITTNRPTSCASCCSTVNVLPCSIRGVIAYVRWSTNQLEDVGDAEVEGTAQTRLSSFATTRSERPAISFDMLINPRPFSLLRVATRHSLTSRLDHLERACRISLKLGDSDSIGRVLFVSRADHAARPCI